MMLSDADNTIPIRLTRTRPCRTDGLTPPPGVDVDYMVRMREGGEAAFWSGLLDDMPRGVFIPTYRTHPIGSRVAVALEIPGRADLLVANTVVRWVREASDAKDCAPPGVGLEFLSLSGQARQSIERFSKLRGMLLYDVD